MPHAPIARSRPLFALLLLATAGLAHSQLALAKGPKAPQPPVAAELPYAHTEHGDVRPDPYFWLKHREDKKVQAYLRAENAYADEVMQPSEALQATLFAEMKGRIKPDDSSYPAPRGPYAYFIRNETGKEYPIYCRQATTPGAHLQVLVDGNELAKGHAYFHIGGAQVSPDHKVLAFATDTVGRRIYTLHFKDLATGKLLDDSVPATTGNFVWANDNRTVFYTKQHPETLRSEKVFRRELGRPEAALVYEEKDETFEAHLYRGEADKHLFIQSTSTLSSEVRFVSADRPLDPWQVFEPRSRGHEYTVHDGGDRFFVLTNLDAKNFRVMQAPLAKTVKAGWQDVVPHRADTLVEDLKAFQGHLVLEERSQGLSQLQVVDRATGKGRHLAFRDPVYVAAIGENLTFDSDWVRYEYESMTTPVSVYDHNLRTGETLLRKQKEVLGGFKAENYESKRLFARATDGTQVPMSLVYRKGWKPTPAAPLLVYGYGAYGHSMDPRFNGNILSLLDRGFCYAILHVRGGSEMGRAWYEDGRQMKKMNSFTDFVAATESLHAQGFSSPAHTYAMGGSAGGLLMGAVMNLRPDLYRGIVAQVPFVDVVTTMLDASIPLTTAEYDEWGNPNQKAAYDYIKAYSPYDNVAAKAYPNLMVTTGLHDSQVQYWEPAKWVARLRKLKTDSNLLLFKTEMAAGHGGKSGRFERLKLWALQYAFFLRFEPGSPASAPAAR